MNLNANNISVDYLTVGWCLKYSLFTAEVNPF